MTDDVMDSAAARHTSSIEAELESWLDSRSPIGAHYDMLRYHMGWMDETLRPARGPRGKRFRPLLCLLSAEAVGGQATPALPMAAAIEFLHNFSLIHDDIEDHDESRHHRPSLWKLWGEPLAINAGDAMLALSGIASLSIPNQPFLAARFQETSLALTEGQYLDMSFEARSRISTEEYFHMISLKTGALITFSCEAGAILGGGSVEQVETMRSFGRHFGLAFQIYDDIRGLWAGTEETGKIAGKDISNRKKTLPVVLALDHPSGSASEELVAYYEHGANVNPEEIAAIINELGIRNQVHGILEDNLQKGFSALRSGELQEHSIEEIYDFARGLVESEPERKS